MIDGKTYSGMRVFAGAQPGNGWSFFKVLVADTDKPDERAEIRIDAEVRWQLEIKSFEGGKLRNLETGKEIGAPWSFGPGNYHFVAVKE